VKIEFDYKIFNQDNKLICAARTVLVCVDKDFKPQSIPVEIKAKIAQGK